MRSRESIILTASFLVAFAMIIGANSTYSEIWVRAGIAIFFSAFAYLRARIHWVKWLALGIIWSGFFVSFLV